MPILQEFQDEQRRAAARLADPAHRADPTTPSLIVYVVGAGASHAISGHYPLGRDLTKEYVDDAKKMIVDYVSRVQHYTPEEAAEQAVKSVRTSWFSEFDEQVSPTDAIAFAEALVAYDLSQPTASIDDLLTSERINPSALKAGRRALGMSILNAMASWHREIHDGAMPGSQGYEKGPPVRDQKWDWLNVVAGRVHADLASGSPQWEHAFVTFNYDRNVEYYLWNYLKDAWGPNDERVVRETVLSGSPVVHVHGAFYGKYYDRFPEHLHPNDETSDMASDAMVLVGERTESFRRTSGVPELTAAADRVVFLGFAYDKRNLERIAPPSPSADVDLMGTAYGMSHAQRAAAQHAVQEYFGSSEDLRLGEPKEGCAGFLKNRGVWAPLDR